MARSSIQRRCSTYRTWPHFRPSQPNHLRRKYVAGLPIQTQSPVHRIARAARERAIRLRSDVPHGNHGTDSEVVLRRDEAPMPYVEHHWSAKALRAFVAFYLRHWQWIWSTVIAVAALYVAALALK